MMGEWIHHVVNGMDYYECSECKTYFYKKYMMRKNYCSNCGAGMRGKQMNKAELIKALAELLAEKMEIGEEPTNGDIMMAMFPNATVEYLEYSNYIHIADGIGFKINRSWWNAPYQKGGEE